MSWIVKTAVFVNRRHWTKWEKLSADPGRSQKELLLGIVRRNRATEFGKDHRFESIRSLDDYRHQVTIGDYERLRPYVERAENGEPNVLTDEPVLMFTLTSGSTGAPKLIPVTESARANHRRLTRLWYYRAYLDHPNLFNGKLLGVISPAQEGRTRGNIPFGAASGLIHQSSPLWIQNAFAVPDEVAQVKDFTAKYYLIMRLAIEQEVSFFGTPNPSTILRLVETADQSKSEIIRDIRDGAISQSWNIPATTRQALAPYLRKNPARAAQLEKFVDRVGALRPHNYWPGLALIGCWKGGSAGVRLTELPRWFGETVPVRDLGYMASEAQITLPIADAGCAGLLDVSANFYEFIAETEFHGAAPVTLTCDQLEPGRSYYLMLTTPAGLYRYDINDVVRVAGFYKKIPILEFLRKGRDVTNITGEKLHINQVILAMEQARRAAGISVRHFRAYADVEKSRYAFMIEPEGTNAHEGALANLLQQLDTSLSALNIEYADKRKSDRLKAPILCIMKSGWFERKAGTALRAGARDVQFKAQLLSAIPEESSEILFVVDNVESRAGGPDHQVVNLPPR
jgi:hypothetical protein